DFAHFRRSTLGKPLIMGRKTFESIGKPLAGRTNIVVSRAPGLRFDGAEVFDTLASAISFAQGVAEADGASEIMIGGGGQIYREALPLAARLYISHVEAEPKGDVTFPEIDPSTWRVVAEPQIEPHPRDTA